LNQLIPGTSGSWLLQSATGINDAGEIVGTGTTNGFQHAFLLTPTTAVTVPAAPLIGTATSGNGFVQVSWQASVGATSYNVKRATTFNGPFTTIVTGLKTTSFTDLSALNCTTYYYVVSGLNSAGESPNSSSVIGSPEGVPPAPGNLTAGPNTQPNLFLGSAISLAWQNNTTCAQFVLIQRSTDGVNFQPLVTLGAVQNTYTDGFLNSGTRYFYRAQSQSTGGSSGFSKVASAVAP
jgi:cellulose 1,4-beta-cellobiosidase